MEYLQLRWRKSSNENKSKLINNAVQLWWEFLDWNVRLMGFKQWNPYKGIRLRYSTSYLQSSAMAFQSRFKTLILHNISRTVIVLFFLLKHLNIFYLNFGSNSSFLPHSSAYLHPNSQLMTQLTRALFRLIFFLICWLFPIQWLNSVALYSVSLFHRYHWQSTMNRYARIVHDLSSINYIRWNKVRWVVTLMLH